MKRRRHPTTRERETESLREQIAMAAIQRDGIIFCGFDHGQAYALCPAKLGSIDWTQGFLTTRGRFVTREEAYEIALRCGQIIDITPLDRALVSVALPGHALQCIPPYVKEIK
jgi:hypothetical protein